MKIIIIFFDVGIENFTHSKYFAFILFNLMGLFLVLKPKLVAQIRAGSEVKNKIEDKDIRSTTILFYRLFGIIFILFGFVIMIYL